MMIAYLSLISLPVSLLLLFFLVYTRVYIFKYFLLVLHRILCLGSYKANDNLGLEKVAAVKILVLEDGGICILRDMGGEEM